MASTALSFHLANWNDIQQHLPMLKAAAHGDCMEIGVRGGVSTSAPLCGLEEKGGHLYSFDIDNVSDLICGHDANQDELMRGVHSVIPQTETVAGLIWRRS